MGASLIALPLAVWERDGLKAAPTKAGLPADDILTPARAVFFTLPGQRSRDGQAL